MYDSSYYGVVPIAQPSGDPTAPVAHPESTVRVRTQPLPSQLPITGHAGFWIVAIIALAAGLIHLSIRFS